MRTRALRRRCRLQRQLPQTGSPPQEVACARAVTALLLLQPLHGLNIVRHANADAHDRHDRRDKTAHPSAVMWSRWAREKKEQVTLHPARSGSGSIAHSRRLGDWRMAAAAQAKVAKAEGEFQGAGGWRAVAAAAASAPPPAPTPALPSEGWALALRRRHCPHLYHQHRAHCQHLQQGQRLQPLPRQRCP